MDRPLPGRYKVKVRRGFADVRPESELVDGKEFDFTPGWKIDDVSIYLGEWAMIPKFEGYPENAPTWIAIGDLELVRDD